MDKWSSIRSSYDDNHLFFCTPDKKNIPFNREICCALSPFLFNLIQGTFEESCCRTNYDTYIILPDFSSKTVYDLAALMIKGTVRGISAQCTKELKSLHSFLGFQSFIVKEENGDDITCSHEYRIEDDKMEEDHGDGGDNGEEEASKNDRSLGNDDTVVKMETGETENDEANVMNDERMEEMTGEDVSIPSSSKEKDDDADMNDNDPSTPTVHGASPLPNTFSCASLLGWNEAADGHNTRNAQEEFEEDVHLKQKKSIKITPKRPVNIESESDVSYHVDITNPSKKRKSGRSKAAVSYSAMDGYNKSSGLYECGICDKKFQERSSARHHMAIHQGKTICEVCKKVLSRTSALRLHMKKVHNEGSE